MSDRDRRLCMTCRGNGWNADATPCRTCQGNGFVLVTYKESFMAPPAPAPRPIDVIKVVYEPPIPLRQRQPQAPPRTYRTNTIVELADGTQWRVTEDGRGEKGWTEVPDHQRHDTEPHVSQRPPQGTNWAQVIANQAEEIREQRSLVATRDREIQELMLARDRAENMGEEVTERLEEREEQLNAMETQRQNHVAEIRGLIAQVENQGRQLAEFSKASFEMGQHAAAQATKFDEERTKLAKEMDRLQAKLELANSNEAEQRKEVLRLQGVIKDMREAAPK